MRQAAIVLLSMGLLAGLAAGEEELIWREGKWVRQAKPAEGTAAGELAAIRRKMDRKKYAAAAKRAKRFLKRYPADPLREEVLGLAGEAELRRGRHWQAYTWYEKQLGEFPSGAGVGRALERETEIAQVFLAGKKRRVAGIFMFSCEDDGIEILERIADFAPGTPQAEEALLTIADHHYGKSRWADAAGGYELFLRLYAQSPRAPRAELRLAEALLRSYRGPAWDEAPLIEAEQRYKAFAAQRPAAARRARVEKILEAIHLARAEKQYEIGRFYLRTRRPTAAAYYFRLVAKDYADTHWAGRAMAGLGGLERPGGSAPPGAPGADTKAPSPRQGEEKEK